MVPTEDSILEHLKKFAYKVIGFLTLLIFIFIVFQSRFVTPVSSQDTLDTEEAEPQSVTLNEILREYDTAKQNYESTHSNYVLARSQYLKFKTLKSRNDAREATLLMLEARDEVVILYLTALRERLKEAVGVSEDRFNDLTIRLNEEIGFFETHKLQLSSASTPEDLAKDSDKAKIEFEEVNLLFYEVMGTISYGKTKDLHDRSVDLFSEMQTKVEEIRNDESEARFSDLKMQAIDRIVSESDGRLFRSGEKLTESEVSLNKIGTKARSADYNELLLKLEEGRGYLGESFSFMSEVIREIKTSED